MPLSENERKSLNESYREVQSRIAAMTAELDSLDANRQRLDDEMSYGGSGGNVDHVPDTRRRLQESIQQAQDVRQKIRSQLEADARDGDLQASAAETSSAVAEPSPDDETPSVKMKDSGPATETVTTGGSYSASLSTHITQDAWTTEDALGFEGYAYAIAAFLTHEKSKPPITISIQAPWGGGKTSLMRMVQHVLDPEAKAFAESDREPTTSPPETEKPAAGAGPGLTVGQLDEEMEKRLEGQDEALPNVTVKSNKTNRVTVWFNAWKYESANQVWAGLVDAILQQVPSRLPRVQQELFWLRLNLARVSKASIRQKLHNYFIHRLIRTSAGLVWACIAGAVSAVLLPLLGYMGVAGLQQLTEWLGVPGLATATFLLVLPIAKIVSVHFKVKNEPVAEVLNELVEVPKYSHELGFIHHVEKDLRKVFDSLPGKTSLVIFIDDLDRCSPPKVASVLEAINLFLAGDFRDCSFVLGMDSELVAAALQTAHKDLSEALPSDVRVPIGWRFMDKFVQLPFVIPPVSTPMQHRFLRHLLGDRTPGAEPDGPYLSSLHGESESEEERVEMSDEAFRQSVDSAGGFDDDNPEYQTLVLAEAPFFKGNPRELKIFLNLFRFNQLIWFARTGNHSLVPSKEALCRWTALSVKWPEHIRWLRRVDPKNMGGRRHAGIHAKGKEAKYPKTPLETLEMAAQDASDADTWSLKIKEMYKMGDNVPAWTSDVALFRHYKDGPRLSEYEGAGFW